MATRAGVKRRTARNGRQRASGRVFGSGDVAPRTTSRERPGRNTSDWSGSWTNAGVLERTDPRLIELYAVNYELVRKAYEQLSKDGPTIITDKGNTLEHPCIRTINGATIRLKAIINDLGLCPASSKLTNPSGGEANKTEDKWAGLLNVVG